MGFGKSETPPDRAYTLRTHVENLTALIEALDLHDITLVMQDWGGPIGVGYAVRHPERIHSLVLMNTVVGYGTAGRRDLPSPLETPWFRWIRDGLPTGRTEAVLSQLGSTILSVLQIVGLERLDRVDPTFLRAYGAPFPTPADCKGAIEFPLDLALGRIRDFVQGRRRRRPRATRKTRADDRGHAGPGDPPGARFGRFLRVVAERAGDPGAERGTLHPGGRPRDRGAGVADVSGDAGLGGARDRFQAGCEASQSTFSRIPRTGAGP